MTEPSNNDWRIAGALGLETEPTDPSTQEVMTQGLGFPLRPVGGVPAKQAPDASEIVALGTPMQWMGNWAGGKYYPQGAFVRDGDWTAIANKLTLDKPAPIPSAVASYSLDWTTPGPPPTVENNTSVVVGGQTYTFAESGWIKELRIWISVLTDDTNYRIIIINETDPERPVSTVIEEPVLVENDWTTISLLDMLVPAGTVLRMYVDALNSATETNITGSWNFEGPTNAGVAPAAQSWTRDNQRTNLRIDKTDLDGTDRSAALESVIPNSLIRMAETDSVGNASSYRVNTVTDQSTYMEYTVTLVAQSGGDVTAGAVTTVNIDVPIPVATEYVEELLVWGTPPTWATSVEGFLLFNGVDQAVPTTNAYGVDILFEPAEISLDWDIVSFTG